jgi:hypothetical protein
MIFHEGASACRKLKALAIPWIRYGFTSGGGARIGLPLSMNPASDFDFNETGDCFQLRSPRLLARADFDLWNDSFCITGDPTGRVDGRVFTPNAQPYAESLRAVYLVDLETGGHRSLTWGPVFEDPPRNAGKTSAAIAGMASGSCAQPPTTARSSERRRIPMARLI